MVAGASVSWSSDTTAAKTPAGKGPSSNAAAEATCAGSSPMSNWSSVRGVATSRQPAAPSQYAWLGRRGGEKITLSK